MLGPIPYQILRPIPGKWYVCEKLQRGGNQPVDFRSRRLTEKGYDTEAEAQAAADEIVKNNSAYRANLELHQFTTETH